MKNSSNSNSDMKNNSQEWTILEMLAILLITFLLQSILLPCLCAEGTAKVNYACAIDILIVVRIIIAKVRHEKGKVWLFYKILLLTSPVWINILSWIINSYQINFFSWVVIRSTFLTAF